ncbi:hypothetical protein SLEP1_g41625 [Rubroshorea leprosula]|uniref:Uncharacterized protein n=1 Tax=Rubroshorea leprosula TaxID=152421 RepID=A0AAV5L7K6_9ROSI|nr:hypothetical protein SLEP1_g41625 [Rubroshorea leprosula]
MKVGVTVHVVVTVHGTLFTHREFPIVLSVSTEIKCSILCE